MDQILYHFYSFHTAHFTWFSDLLEVLFSNAAALEPGGLAGWAVLGGDKVSSPPVHV